MRNAPGFWRMVWEEMPWLPRGSIWVQVAVLLGWTFGVGLLIWFLWLYRWGL